MQKDPQKYVGVQPYNTKWVLDVAEGYNIRVNCTITVDKCSVEDILVSRSGHPALLDAQLMCGDYNRSNRVFVSTGQYMTIGILTFKVHPKPTLICYVTAQPKPDPYCKCGYRLFDRSTVSGKDIHMREYPMAASIYYETFLKCGGIIIDKRHVVTSAWCVSDDPARDYNVGLGYAQNDSLTKVYQYDFKKVYNVSHVIAHDLSVNADYNIGLVRTSEDMLFNVDVAPACLPYKFANTDFNGATVTLLLFEAFTRIQRLDVQLECRATSTSLTEKQTCSFPKSHQLYHDISWDKLKRGSPILFKDPSTGLFFLYGFVRKVNKRENQLYTMQAAPLLDWIMDTTRDYCDDCHCKL